MLVAFCVIFKIAILEETHSRQQQDLTSTQSKVTVAFCCSKVSACLEISSLIKSIV